MRTISVIGCGRVGLVLATLMSRNKVLTIRHVLNRTIDQAKKSVGFIGEGIPTTSIAEVSPSDLYMITTPDDKIIESSEDLAKYHLISPSSIIFHCSGIMPSTDLSTLTSIGAHVASIHPVKSFADPQTAVATFKGTYCAIEGDNKSVELLTHIFEQIGGITFPVKTHAKALYHAALVMVCNNLVGLIALGEDIFKKSGIPENKISHIIEPLVKETVNNVFKIGVESALTGPIDRGDYKTIQKHIDALSDDHLTQNAYKLLGQSLLNIIKKRDIEKQINLEEMRAIIT